jgi:hypothetical protein
MREFWRTALIALFVACLLSVAIACPRRYSLVPAKGFMIRIDHWTGRVALILPEENGIVVYDRMRVVHQDQIRQNVTLPIDSSRDATPDAKTEDPFDIFAAPADQEWVRVGLFLINRKTGERKVVVPKGAEPGLSKPKDP